MKPKPLFFLFADRASIRPPPLSIYFSVSLQVSFNNRVPGERLNSTVENLLLVGRISENPSARRCMSAQWERGEDWREVKN